MQSICFVKFFKEINSLFILVELFDVLNYGFFGYKGVIMFSLLTKGVKYHFDLVRLANQAHIR